MRAGSFGLRYATTVLALALAPAAAMAYIDPGNGAYMVQALFTLVGAAKFYLRHPIRSVRAAWNSVSMRWRRPVAPQGDGPATSDGPAVESSVGHSLRTNEEL